MKIYCSGVGGIGLSAYASLQKAKGHDVMGSDRCRTALTDGLDGCGISITTDQTGAAIPSDANLFVYSEAIPADAPERRRAAELGIRQLSYPQALGELSRGSRIVAVCGTHGKSSTTGMAARLLLHSGRDPTVVVGTKLKELEGRNWRKGRPDLFLLEACEYRNSFHFYDPSIVLLTNCDGDHFDFFASRQHYRDSFVAFVEKLPPDGVLITHMGDPDCRAVAEAAGKRIIDADAFPLVTLRTPGMHMRQNAQLVLALASHIDVPAAQAQAAVSGYSGSWRRMELRGLYNDIPVIDDYAHHPREIRATLQAVMEQYPGRRIVCVFQPHTHDRTLALYDDFAGAFSGIDTVIITDVYEARKDIEKRRVDMAKFVRDIEQRSGVRCQDGTSLDHVRQLLIAHVLRSGDVLICMGAGTVTDLAETMVSG